MHNKHPEKCQQHWCDRDNQQCSLTLWAGYIDDEHHSKLIPSVLELQKSNRGRRAPSPAQCVATKRRASKVLIPPDSFWRGHPSLCPGSFPSPLPPMVSGSFFLSTWEYPAQATRDLFLAPATFFSSSGSEGLGNSAWRKGAGWEWSRGIRRGPSLAGLQCQKLRPPPSIATGRRS